MKRVLVCSVPEVDETRNEARDEERDVQTLQAPPGLSSLSARPQRKERPEAIIQKCVDSSKCERWRGAGRGAPRIEHNEVVQQRMRLREVAAERKDHGHKDERASRDQGIV